LLSQWLQFRTATVKRRLEHRLARVTQRLHILDALLIAYLNIDAVIKIIRTEDKPKPVLMKRFKLTEVQAEAILELKLRHLAKLEEMKIRGEQEELAAEEADLTQTLKSKPRLIKLVKTEIQELKEKYGDARRTAIVERAAAQAIDESELVTAEPVTVVLSEGGWARAAKGHEVDVASLAYRSGDAFLAAARGKSNQLAVFIDSTGRAYSVGAHTLPSARGQGEPLSGHFNPPDGSSFRAVLIGAPEDRWVVASSKGYGFVVKLEELYSRNKAGKAVLRVPPGSGVVPAAPVPPNARRLAAVSNDGRLLVFPLAQLPELAKGKGNKILGLPSKGDAALAAVCVLTADQALKVLSGSRHMTIKAADLGHYAAERGRRGSALPRGWRKIDGLLPE
jgi:topoisomerase-4 subunit A